MDPRIAFRLAIIFAGMFLAGGRRTASAWFAAAGVQDDWDRFYDCPISVGRTSAKLATAVLGLVVQKFAPGFGDRILLAMDDSPTSRYGKRVEGAGVHHNPTPGPADGEWLYGHNWVALAWLEAGRTELLCGSGDDKLYALKATGGKCKVLWNVDLGARVESPVIADLDGDRRPEILVSSADGRLHCLGRTALLTSKVVKFLTKLSGRMAAST